MLTKRQTLGSLIWSGRTNGWATVCWTWFYAQIIRCVLVGHPWFKKWMLASILVVKLAIMLQWTKRSKMSVQLMRTSQQEPYHQWHALQPINTASEEHPVHHSCHPKLRIIFPPRHLATDVDFAQVPLFKMSSQLEERTYRKYKKPRKQLLCLSFGWDTRHLRKASASHLFLSISSLQFISSS